MNNFKLQSDPIGEVIFNGIVYVPKGSERNAVLDEVLDAVERKEELAKNGYDIGNILFDKDDISTIIKSLMVK